VIVTILSIAVPLEKLEDDEEQIRDELSGSYLHIAKGRSFMFDNIVTTVDLYPFDRAPRNYEFWDKVGQIVGNLMELKAIYIHFLIPLYVFDADDDGDEARMPDWETLTRILPHLRQKITLCSFTEDYDAEVEDIQGLARAIHGHPMISEFSSQSRVFTFANFGPWCYALATLTSLERVEFGLQEPETEEEEGDLLNLEPLKELLQMPALRFVRFDNFYFTNELCHATANKLEEGSSITDIIFDSGCFFPDGGRAIIANALKTNASVTDVQFLDDCDESFCNTLAVVLLYNSTLQSLVLRLPEEGAGGRWLSPIFLSLRTNTTLKSLTADIFDEFGEELCAAIRNGLEKNSTLEELLLDNMVPSDDDGAVSARNALSFLRTNSTLKSLTVSFAPTQK
jgi:hypothetical protein